MLTVAGGGETGDPDIDAGLAAGRRQRIGRHVITREHQHPAPPLTLDLDRLHPTLHLAVHVNLDLPDALQIHPPLLGQPARAVTVFGPLHTVEPRLSLESRIAGFLPGLDPAEESGERLIQPAQRGLLTRKRPHRLIRARRPDLGQLRGLIPVVDPGLAVRPRIPAFLQCRVVQLPVRLHTRRQRDVLARRRTQPKHIRPSHDDITASLRSDTPPTVRSGADKLVTTRCSPALDPRRLKARRNVVVSPPGLSASFRAL